MCHNDKIIRTVQNMISHHGFYKLLRPTKMHIKLKCVCYSRIFLFILVKWYRFCYLDRGKYLYSISFNAVRTIRFTRKIPDFKSFLKNYFQKIVTRLVHFSKDTFLFNGKFFYTTFSVLKTYKMCINIILFFRALKLKY